MLFRDFTLHTKDQEESNVQKLPLREDNKKETDSLQILKLKKKIEGIQDVEGNTELYKL